jgi:hypothetical protein
MQQHFVADDDRADRTRIFLGERDRGLNQLRILEPVVTDPDSQENLQPDLRCQFRHLVQTVVDGIGTDAARYPGNLNQVLTDLLRTDFQRGIEWRLVVAEWRIGYAFEFVRSIDRGMRECDRLGQPPPNRGNDRQRYQEKRQRRANGNWFYPPRNLSIMVQSSMVERNSGW